jgi:hypothetical protein
MSTNYDDPYTWLAPHEWLPRRAPYRNASDDAYDAEILRRCKSRIVRAKAALAAAGREPVVRANYWLDGGWHVSDRANAVPPQTIRDAHWKVHIPARTSEDVAVELTA